MTLSFKTEDKHGYSVQFSPFDGSRIVCSACQFYGIAGIGSAYVFEVQERGIVMVQRYNWPASIFDAVWCEQHPNCFVTASGDGSLQIWNLALPREPTAVLKGHSKEVSGVSWSQTRVENYILSASWDGTVRLWDPRASSSQDGACVSSFCGHENMAYSVKSSPHIPGCFASSSADQTLRVWDSRKPYMAGVVLHAHNGDVLDLDWSKYNQNQIASAGADGAINIWDLRKPRLAICKLDGHTHAVRRIKFCPHAKDILFSSSYDFTVRRWDVVAASCLQTVEHHSEFVYGLDLSLHAPGRVVDCAWDGLLKVYALGLPNS